MTLCVAWKWADAKGTVVHFAADTCVSLAGAEMEFGGVKIAEIPISYSGPRENETGKQERLSLVYGFAFAGDYLAAYLIRELTGQMLANLQGIGAPLTVSFDSICALVVKVHAHFHKEIGSKLAAGEHAEFFLGGLCPASNKVRVAKFFVDTASAQTKYDEVLLRTHGESYETIGSPTAQNRFKELIGLNLAATRCRVHFAMFRRLRDVILDPSIPSVGGAIQCGECTDATGFRLLGSGMVALKDGRPVMKFYLAGTDIDELHKPSPTGLFVHPTHAIPFNEDIATFDFSTVIQPNTGKRVPLDELITVLPHDTRWSQQFAEERKRLKQLLGWRVDFEHIGSTSVPDLAAVPVLDLMVALDPTDLPESVVQKLQGLGYEYLGHDPRGHRPHFRLRGKCHFNLFVAPKGSVFWREAIAIRAFLQSNDEYRKQYGTHKVQILNQICWTLVRYDEEKVAKFDEIRALALDAIKSPSRPWWKRWIP